MKGVNTVSHAYTYLCRAIIDTALEDASDINFIGSIEDYIDSGYLAVQCFLAKMAYDLVRDTLVSMISLTKKYNRMPVTYVNKSDNSLMYFRTKKNLTRQELSRLIDVPVKLIYDYEWGYQPLDNELAFKLARLLDCDMSSLLRNHKE